MRISEFITLIIKRFGMEPTADQRRALSCFGSFLADRSDRCVMIMRGSAGTGKTSLAAAMVGTLAALGQKLQLMAPTGRAAKVFSVHCHLPASTIHRHIYRRKSAVAGSFSLNDNLYRNELFVVDEASMISGTASGETVFGTNSLLDDLLEYVYGGQNCRLFLIGDTAQLPPVGEEESPALQSAVLEAYGMHVYQCDLNEVVRQRLDSGILWNATMLRALITHDEITQLPKIRFQGFADIVMLPGAEFVEAVSSSYSHVGEDETMIVTRSNKRANIYNIGIRNTVLDREEELVRGDMLMVVRNKYLDEGQPVNFIANGDRAVVVSVHNFRELYGFHFADVTLRFPDYEDFELASTAILDTLHSDAPALTASESQQLFESVMEDYADMPRKTDRMAALKNDNYYNALQIKYAYAVTCHKAQGGQWAHIYLDQGYMTDDMLTPDYIHWLYTAFTRATEKLFLVNWPSTQTQ